MLFCFSFQIYPVNFDSFYCFFMVSIPDFTSLNISNIVLCAESENSNLQSLWAYLALGYSHWLGTEASFLAAVSLHCQAKFLGNISPTSLRYSFKLHSFQLQFCLFLPDSWVSCQPETIFTLIYLIWGFSGHSVCGVGLGILRGDGWFFFLFPQSK